MTVRVINADVLVGLSQLADESVHCVVTSPPYFGLRDYGVDGQIGLEATPAEFVQRLVDVFREVRRVLRSDGTCWLNMGDSYAAGGGSAPYRERDTPHGEGRKTPQKMPPQSRAPTPAGFKQKDLLLIPERLAIALCDDGWYIRSRIIWHKPNPMPESVTDRPTKSHEHIWLMSKQPRYFYDSGAIKEQAALERAGKLETSFSTSDKASTMRRDVGRSVMRTEWRNARDVWTIATQPFSEAHFATFPPDLAERCIKAGTSEKGCCAKCGKPWVRQTGRVDQGYNGSKYGERAVGASGGAISGGTAKSTLGSGNGKLTGKSETVGWAPSCSCQQVDSLGSAVVLDPFGGAGTTGLVADRLQRNAILIELNPEYAAMIERRLTKDAPLFAEVST